MVMTERYIDQLAFWPKSGRHILAQANAESILVYQAYQSSIGHFAAEHGYFGDGFSYSRMSWIKTNFLWMMYRSGWGTKPGQEITLAIRIQLNFFDTLLAQAVESTFSPNQFSTREEWLKAVSTSSIRMQWDPDHNPMGAPLSRRALQLCLRGAPLKEFGKKAIIEIHDISPFVAEQREKITQQRLQELVTPVERIYLPESQEV